MSCLLIQGVPEKIAQSLSMPFLAKCLHDKGQWLNNAIKYSLLFSWQLKYLKTKQSTCWQHHVLFSHLHMRNRFGVRRRLHGKNLFIQEPSTGMTDLALSHTFLQTLACIQSFQFVCCCQGLNFTASKHFDLFVTIFTTEECEIPVSLVISRGLLLLSLVVILGCKLSH